MATRLSDLIKELSKDKQKVDELTIKINTSKHKSDDFFHEKLILYAIKQDLIQKCQSRGRYSPIFFFIDRACRFLY